MTDINQHLDKVYENMNPHLNEHGFISRVTKESRKAARESAKGLGITEAEHGQVMIRIHERHIGHGAKVNK
jgi:hypothetical protein